MRDFEITLFTEALLCAQEERFIEAIEGFKELVSTCPESELSDDACYNIGLCYVHMNQAGNAMRYFQKVIDEYPEGTISVLGGEDEYGMTASKARFAMMRCLCSLGGLEDARIIYDELKEDQKSYVIQDNVKVTFASLGLSLIEQKK